MSIDDHLHLAWIESTKTSDRFGIDMGVPVA